MGKMKEIFMDMIRKEYNGDHDAYTEELARQTCEEFIEEDAPCPNCYQTNLMRNEKNAVCESCGQAFVYVENNLRFI